MRNVTRKLALLGALTGVWTVGGQTAQAGGYYYQTRSLYVMPPMYAYQPVFGPQPMVVYEPVVTYPAPVAGYVVPAAMPAQVVVPAPAPVVQYPAPATVVGYGPAPVPVAVGVGVSRMTERQVTTPFQNRYRYHLHNAYGPDYTYRVRDNGHAVRFSERWSR